jgi:ABC-type transport system involved in multi-copper enzyme maturation permease subunit
MKAIVAIAGLTIRESVRRRVVWVLLGLTIVSVGLTTWGVQSLVSLGRENGSNELEVFVGVSQVLVLVAFMFSFVLAMTAAFLAAPAIATDLESGIAQSMLARPIRRTDLVVGRWLGLSIVVIAYALASGLLEVLAVRIVSGYSPPNPLEAAAYLAAQAVVLLTVALMLSTRLPAMASGAICVVLFGLGWMAGVFAGVGRFLDAGPLVSVAEASRWFFPSDGLWRGAVHALEPPIVVSVAAGRVGAAADANPFYASTAPPAAFLAWAVVWTALVLGVAAMSLERRDL